jgi:hypothetical protein
MSSTNLSMKNDSYALALSYIASAIIHAYDTQGTLNLTQVKSAAAKKFKIKGIPRLSDILQAIPQTHRSHVVPYLVSKPVRTASGVAVVAVMSKVRWLQIFEMDTHFFFLTILFKLFIHCPNSLTVVLIFSIPIIMSAYIVQVGQTPTLNTLPKRIQGMNRHRCEPSELGMIPLDKRSVD